MRPHRSLPTTWPATIDAIVRGDRPNLPFALLGRTPDILVKLGLSPARLVMTCGKIARCRREHPDVPLDVWRKLPSLVNDPFAAFPSEKKDGSIVVVLVVTDAAGNPVIVPIAADHAGKQNVVLSVYGKEAGHEWVQAQLTHHSEMGAPLFRGKGFAAALPKPGFTEVVPSSSGPIPVDGTAKPEREILTVKPKVKIGQGSD